MRNIRNVRHCVATLVGERDLERIEDIVSCDGARLKDTLECLMHDRANLEALREHCNALSKEGGRGAHKLLYESHDGARHGRVRLVSLLPVQCEHCINESCVTLRSEVGDACSELLDEADRAGAARLSLERVAQTAVCAALECLDQLRTLGLRPPRHVQREGEGERGGRER
eukprot:scaffold297003_cov33-Tisochrysis_lutea.AAC.2